MAGQPPGRPAAPATKTARQSQIVGILSREQVHSQEQLAGLLAQYAGLHVAQATLSRDLDELGVVRLRAADGTLVYALPGDPGGPGSRPGTGLDHANYQERTAAPGVAADPANAGHPRPGAQVAVGSPSSDTGPGSKPGLDADQNGAPGSGATAAAAPSTPTAPGEGGAATTTAGPGRADPGSVPADAAPTGEPAGRPSQPAGPIGVVSARFTRYLKELLTSAEGSANIVVLRTPAGAAQFLASTIDHAAWPAILGTVAGDDTVLVISRDPLGGEALAAQFRQLAEGRR